MMNEIITVSGLIATTPRHLVTQDDRPITTFRLAASQRRYDTAQDKWVDIETNWYTITSFRQLAINLAESFNKGDRVLIQGRVIVREWDNGERSGTSVEIEAINAGHSLSWGTSVFTRTVLVRDDHVPDYSNLAN
jgi:single-strand DNA-binding protein